MEEFLSVCDGIGAAQEAWIPLGWRPILLSEIDPFPRAVLRHRHQAVDAALSPRPVDSVPLWGDFTALRPRHFDRFGIRVPSLLVGGTPCQDFSIAGQRAGLDGDRGNLTLQFIRLVNAIDNLRVARGLPPLVIVWENVPGVLSDKKNAFGCFVGALVGAGAPLVPGRKQRWTDSGLVAGPRRAAAWRTLDAQYFGLAQRRRRVFVVSSARGGFDPGAVLFEPEDLRRHSPPRREAGKNTAGRLTSGLVAFNSREDPDVSGDISGPLGASLPQSQAIAFALRGREDGAVPEVNADGETIGTLRAADGGSSRDYVAYNFEHRLAPHGSLASDTVPALTKSEDKECAAVQVDAAVRRLTPVECERLQGFDDNFTLVPYRNGLAADGPRYKALGNSMAVPCMAWIGRRLQAHLEFIGPHKPVPPQHDEHFWAWLREEGLL